MNDKLLEDAVKIAVEKDYKKEVTDFSDKDIHTFPLRLRRKCNHYYSQNLLSDTANV